MAKKKGLGGLGKGLDLLIPSGIEEPVKENGEKKDVVVLKTSQIEPNREQPRKKFDEEKLEELTESIKQYGLIEPIVVCKKDDYYMIVAGERRWRAVKKAGLKEIPVVIKEYTEKEIAEISLIENIQREDLNPIEEANSYKKLIDDYKLTQDELAKRVSKSRSVITNALRLLKLHEEVQKMLVDGVLSAGHARALLGIDNKEKQLKLANEIIEKSLSVRQTEDLVKEAASAQGKKKTKPKDDMAFVYKDLEKKLGTALGTKVKINRRDKGKGKIEINYYSEDELDRIYGIINKGAK